MYRSHHTNNEKNSVVFIRFSFIVNVHYSEDNRYKVCLSIMTRAQLSCAQLRTQLSQLQVKHTKVRLFLEANHTYRLKRWDFDMLLFVVNGTCRCSPNGTQQHYRGRMSLDLTHSVQRKAFVFIPNNS